jgi:hypothetical protein
MLGELLNSSPPAAAGAIEKCFYGFKAMKGERLLSQCPEKSQAYVDLGVHIADVLS